MDWRDDVVKDTWVVHKATNCTGKVHKRFGTYAHGGVQVWVADRGQELENWYWEMLTVRQPRSIKRYPRPLRFPRTRPSVHCHCRGGPMKVEGRYEVRCQNKRCKDLIGDESFPGRIRLAEKRLREAYSGNNKDKPRESEVHQGMARQDKRKTPRSSRSPGKKGKDNKSRVAVRRATKKTSHSRTASRKPVSKPAGKETRVESTNQAVPTGNQEVSPTVPISSSVPVPASEEKEEIKVGTGEVAEDLEEDKLSAEEEEDLVTIVEDDNDDDEEEAYPPTHQGNEDEEL